MKKTVMLIVLMILSLFIFGEKYNYLVDESLEIVFGNEFPLKKINRIKVNGEEYIIGSIIGDKINKNTRLIAPFFELKMGDIDAYETENIIIGWNHLGRIVFISTDDKNAETGFGAKIGDTKEQVLEIFGKPSLETENRFRYENSMFELIGTVLYFTDNKEIGRAHV